MTVLDSLFFSYKDVLLLRKIISVLEFAAAVQHSWSFSIYTKHLDGEKGQWLVDSIIVLFVVIVVKLNKLYGNLI